MILLRSLLFNLLFYFWTLAILVLALPCLVLPRRFLYRIGQLWSGGTLALLAGLCGLQHEVRGLDRLPARPCIVAAKHQSAWDTQIFTLLLGMPAYVFKRELLAIPVFGWTMLRAGSIPVDRRGGARALRGLVAAAGRALARGQWVVIFPEGTRVAPGRHHPYLPGVAALYGQLGVPVVPAAVNSGLFWGRRSFVKRPGRIVLEFLPPIEPGLSRKAFLATLESRIEEASDRLVAEGRGST